MSRNGSGTYSLPAGNPVVTGTTISSTWANNTLTDIATALTGSLAADGQTTATGNLKMGSNRITGLADGTLATDAATKSQVDLTQSAAAITGGTITGAALTNDTIDNTPIGSTTRSTVKATTLDLGLSTQSVAIGQGNASIMKNRIINGAMVIDQRNAGASVTPTNLSYNLDRWACLLTQASKFTVQQNAGSVTPPVGFSKYLGATSSSAYSIAAGDRFGIYQTIEGFNGADLAWGTANAKTITISFQVYSSLTGTFSGNLRTGSGTDYSYVFTYSIPVANTWTTISVTIAGPTVGTWASDNSGFVTVNFSLGVGSTYSTTAGSWTAGNYWGNSSAVSVVGTNGATFYITGVQLEVGSSATGFEYRNYGTELANCQRYFSKSFATETAPVDGLANPYRTICAGYSSDNAWSTYTPYVVTMRTTPTMTIYKGDTGATAGQPATYDGGTWTSVTSNSVLNGYNNGFSLSLVRAGGFSNQTTRLIMFNYTASAEL